MIHWYCVFIFPNFKWIMIMIVIAMLIITNNDTGYWLHLTNTSWVQEKQQVLE